MTVMLTDRQREVLLATLAPFAPPVERVDAHGSRAGGTARPGSDIDLVLAGPIDWTMLARISGAIDDSYFSISADVSAYQLIGEGGFRERLRATAVTLFDAAELRAAGEAASRAA